MDSLKRLARLCQVEALKLWRKPVARLVLAMMLVGPAVGEVLLARLSLRDALFPRVGQFLFSADLLIMIALITVVVSVLALGNDHELGTVRVLLSRGVERHAFILSKVLVSTAAALIYGLAYLAAGLASTWVAHAVSGGAPLLAAAGGDIAWRLLAAAGVLGLVNLVLSGVVMLALVVGRTSWMGMIAGLGYFLGDFVVGGLGTGSVPGVADAYRYTVAYHAISLLERLFPSDPRLALPRGWLAQGPAGTWQAAVTLLGYAGALVILSVVLFKQQDLTAGR